MEQLLLVTSCDSPAGIGASLRTHEQRTDGRTDGWTHRRDVGNSILDLIWKPFQAVLVQKFQGILELQAIKLSVSIFIY